MTRKEEFDKFDYILQYTGHTADGEIVNGIGRFVVFKEYVNQNGEFTPDGLEVAKEIFKRNTLNDLNKIVVCDTITLTTVREGGKVVLEFPYGLGKPMYDSGWRDSRYIGAVKREVDKK